MPDYSHLTTATAQSTRTIERLLALRQQFRSDGVPARTLDEKLLLATWNIRDFDKPAYGERSDEAIAYIAEVISHFDLVALQEVYRDLTALKRVMALLGPRWRYIVTDATEDEPGSRSKRGNDERLAFVFDTGKVHFGGLAGELVLPSIKQSDGTYRPVSQIWRTPYMVGFECGWSRFLLATVHITWGSSEAEPATRVEEIRQVAQFLKRRTEDPTTWARNLILLGDFNIFAPEDQTFAQLTDAGFMIPEALQSLPSNAIKTRHYDQIAFRLQPDTRLDFTGKAGVFDYFQSVFRNEDEELFVAAMGERYHTTEKGKSKTSAGKKTYYRTYWRTHQMSDHLPMWVELKIDYSDECLQAKLEG
ncbi:MAG: endonuclease/exonuclease/phosphatase family protein [Deferrisomatales bacterium]|nr:endonuclease/exonuclease/phosphatase family protein [Deferrisomatales bacterium]